MGIAHELKNSWLSFLLPNVFIQDTGKPWHNHHHVVIEDSLTRLNRFMGDGIMEDERGYSLLTLFREVISFVKTCRDRGARVVVLSLDDKTNVPKEKAEEQKVRDTRAHDPPYPEEYTSVADLPIRFHLGRLLRTRHLRTPLFRYFLQLLIEGKGEIPADVVLVYEFEHDGAHIFMDGTYTGCKTECAHALGESDLSLWYWVGVFSVLDWPIVLHSIDTDQMAIAPLYLSRAATDCTPSNGVYWVYDDKVGYVDFKQFTEAIADNQVIKGCTAELWMALTILSGSDYVKTNKFARQVGVFKIIDVFRLPDVQAKFKEWIQSPTQVSFIRYFIQRMYTQVVREQWSPAGMLLMKVNQIRNKRKRDEKKAEKVLCIIDEELEEEQPGQKKKRRRKTSSPTQEETDQCCLAYNSAIEANNNPVIDELIHEDDLKIRVSNKHKQMFYPDEQALSHTEERFRFNFHYWATVANKDDISIPQQLFLAHFKRVSFV